MDKLARRVRMAERQVARRLKKEAKTEYLWTTKMERMRTTKELGRDASKSIKQAIVARREDWELGPLAPRRDVPRVELNAADNAWGTIGVTRALMSLKLNERQLEARCAWAGGSKYLCLMPGDRVVVVEGTMKGKIDKVAEINIEEGVVQLADAKANVTLPGWFDSQQDTASIPPKIPISAVRLVHPIKDEETGATRDVIIRQLKPFRITRDSVTRTVTWSRVVPGLNVAIPWPKVEKPKKVDYACDTLRIDVEEKTFIPTLLSPPVPEGLIDELRNQYSKFRTRHTEEYIAQKAAEEEEKKAARMKSREMLTPVQEFNRKQREIRRARGQPVLTEEMLAKIGEVMAKNMNGKRVVGSIPAETVAKEETVNMS